MIALLPEGVAIADPDYVKLVKVVPGQAQGAKTYVVVVRLDDGTDLMVKTFTRLGPALELSSRCTEIINAAVLGEALPADLLPGESEASEVYELRSGARGQPQPQQPLSVNPSPSDDSDWVRDDGSDDWE